MVSQPRYRKVVIKVTVQVDDGEERAAGHCLRLFDEDAPAFRMASEVLDAWDAAREAAERTLRLYGAEGLVDALTATPEGDSLEATP